MKAVQSPPGAGSSADHEMDSLYRDSDTKPEGQRKSVDEQEKEEMATTALVPMKVLQGKDGEPPKEGEECTVKIVKVYDDECEIAWAPKKEGSSDESEADAEIDEMDEAGAGHY